MHENTTDKRLARLKAKIEGLKTANQIQSAAEAVPVKDTSQNQLADRSNTQAAGNRKPAKSIHCCNSKVAGFQYKPRNPEKSLLHRIFWRDLEGFLDKANKISEANGLPSFVIKDLRKFSDCSDFRKGLALFECTDCGKQKALAFSCKTRGFCPSCGGKRMTMLAAHLVDNVIPFVPTRQWVLSLPFWLRYRLAYDHKLHREITKIFTTIVTEYYQQHATQEMGPEDAHTGSVSFLQRCGGAMNSNPHNHCLFIDGVFREVEDSMGTSLCFYPARKPTDREIAILVFKIRHEVICLMKDRGLYDADFDQLNDESPLLALCYKASVQNLIALGERAGQQVRRLGSDPIFEKQIERVERRGKLHARYDGFDLHAKQRIHQNDRAQLERTLKYCARPPISEDRLTELEDGNILLKLKTPWRDGTTHIKFTPFELLEKLCVLVPKPGINLLLYHGVLAPNAKLRSQVVRFGREAEQHNIDKPAKQLSLLFSGQDSNDHKDDLPKAKRLSKWHELMARAFKIDVLQCECGGRLKFIDSYCESEKIDEVMNSLGLADVTSHTVDARAPPKPRNDGPLFDRVA